MPKEIGNGKSTMQGLALDGTILANKFSGNLTELTVAVDRAINADLQDDPYMVETLKCIKEARAETNEQAREGLLARAEVAITKAIEIDFTDGSITEIKTGILPYIKIADELKHGWLELQEKLAKAN